MGGADGPGGNGAGLFPDPIAAEQTRGGHVVGICGRCGLAYWEQVNFFVWLRRIKIAAAALLALVGKAVGPGRNRAGYRPDPVAVKQNRSSYVVSFGRR